MTTVAKVNLWGNMVGAVAWNKDRHYASFEYDSNFIKMGLDISPLQMPLDEVRRTKRIYSFPQLNFETYLGLPGLLADSLPDKFGNQLIDVWLARQGRDPKSFNPIERLCYTGKRGMGALEYEPVLSPFKDVSELIEVGELVKLAREVLQEKKNLKVNIHDEDVDKGLLEIIRVGTSAGGARAKAVIAYNVKTGDVRSGQISGLADYEYWIIKFDGVTNKKLGDPSGYGKIEYAYYQMALECGIKMTTSRLLMEKDRAHFMTKRFDREGEKKIHMQTLCALAHYDFNDSMSFSYEQAFQTMRLLKLPYTDMEELYKRMVFNVIARNHDDHTKNISFLMDEKGKWRLSPAYDITYAFDPKNKWMKAHQLSINGKRDEIIRSDLIDVAKRMGIKKPSLIIERIKDAVSKWPAFAKNSGVSSDQIKGIAKLLRMDL